MNKYSERRPMQLGRLFHISFIIIFLLNTITARAHQAPYTIALLDIMPSRVHVELQMPVSEMKLAFGSSLGHDPTTVVKNLGPQLNEYLLAHVHAFGRRESPWRVEIINLRIEKGVEEISGPPFYELVAEILLLPTPGDDTRHFYFDYDAIMHEVINHYTVVSIRSDWERGALSDSVNLEDARIIRRNMNLNVIEPLEINLAKGSHWEGFKSMVSLGMHHIQEGTDHLLFLLVLLLPATLTSRDKRWNRFAGIRGSIRHVLQIVTAFTIGHSLTLILCTLKIIQPAGRVIEVLIAFSILISALHALRPIFGRRAYLIAGFFGLIHGMAFAGTLLNLNLASTPLALSILGFNVGIELMQLFIVLLTIPWLIILSRDRRYRYLRISLALFAIIASIAWMLQRSAWPGNPVAPLIDLILENGRWLIVGLSFIAIVSLFFKETGLSKK
jgi:hypothetical protein